MASSSSSKQLWEHLQEQQKPFVLDAYLSERKIMMNKKQKRPCSYDLNKRRITQTRKNLKLLLLKLTCTSQYGQSVSSCHKAQKHELVLEAIQKPQQIGEMKWLPKVSSSVAVGESFRCSDKESPCYENHASLHSKTSQALTHGSLKQKAAADINLQREFNEQNEQHSPVSVLNELPSIKEVHRFPPKQEEDASASSTVLSINAEDDSIISAFLWDLLIKSLIENQSLSSFTELREMIGPAFSQHLRNERILQQSTKLIFDCVHEAIEVHRRKNRRKQHGQEFIGPQELGKIICEQICSWGKQNAAEQINIDVSSTVEDGCYLQQLNRRIGIEIGDTILNEIIQELIDLLFQ